MNMNIFYSALDEIVEIIPEDEIDNRAYVLRSARQCARITCRELGVAVGLTLGQISDIEHGRLKVDDAVIGALMVVCAARMTVARYHI
jgi:hypothetical protein